MCIGTFDTYIQFNIFKIDLPNKKIICLFVQNKISNYGSWQYGSFYSIFNNKIFYYYDGKIIVYKL